MGRAICGLSTGNFYHCIKQLNPKLRICSFDNSPNAAGLYYIDPREGWISICGVDKGYVPVAATVDEVGHILKSGWVRVVRLLLSQGLTNVEKVRKVWPNFFLSRIPKAEFQKIDPILKQMGKFVSEQEDKRGEQGMDADQIMEIAQQIHKKDSDAKKEADDKSKWELKKVLDQEQKIYI
jgi:hypothetical protein